MLWNLSFVFFSLIRELAKKQKKKKLRCVTRSVSNRKQIRRWKPRKIYIWYWLNFYFSIFIFLVFLAIAQFFFSFLSFASLHTQTIAKYFYRVLWCCCLRRSGKMEAEIQFSNLENTYHNCRSLYHNFIIYWQRILRFISIWLFPIKRRKIFIQPENSYGWHDFLFPQYSMNFHCSSLFSNIYRWKFY